MPFKICMIEDDSDLANLIKEHLVRYDFEVLICEDFKNIDKFIMTAFIGAMKSEESQKFRSYSCLQG